MHKYTMKKLIEINKQIINELVNLYIDLKQIDDEIDLDKSIEITNDRFEITQYMKNLKNNNEDLQTKLQIKEEEQKINGED